MNLALYSVKNKTKKSPWKGHAFTSESLTDAERSRKAPGTDIEKPWGKRAVGPSFNANYPTEFRPSQIPGAGNGWWALADIPAGTQMRRVSVEAGSLLRMSSLDEMERAGW